MYTNYVILAVPLFILAAEIMNIGTMTDRLLHFCNALVGRFRGGLAQVNIVQSHHLLRHVGLGDRRCRRQRAPDAGHDDEGRQAIRTSFAAALTAVPPSSGRSSRPRSRWCSTRSSPTPRSATSSSAASSRAC
jgi:hypothetical protein